MLSAITMGALFASASCLPDPLEVASVPRAPVHIVVSSQIVSDESLFVLLTKSFGALDASDDSDPETLLEQIAINDAMVTVKGPTGTDTLQFLGHGTYGGVTFRFLEGETYALHVNSVEYGEVSAATEVRRKIDFSHVEAELFYDGYDDTLAQITYTFSDPAEKNYYMINVQEVEQEDAIENLLNPRAFTVLLADDEFNGKSYGERFRVFPRDYEPGDSIAVSLANISAEYYDFMVLRMNNRLSFVEFVSEPVNYPSNVLGGKGYFNLYLPDVEFFVFD